MSMHRATARSLLRLLVLTFLVAVAAPARSVDGNALARAVFDRPNGKDATTLTRMTLTERGRSPRTRDLVAYRLDRGRGESMNLVRFLGPPDIAGTGLLSINRASGDAEQSLFLPELDRVRRVAGERKGGRFVGSDIYFEDLQERQPAKDRHRLLGKETVNGVACDVLESVPISPDSSVYLKRISWVDPATALVRRVDFFEREGDAPTKRWLLLASKQIQGYWTVVDSVFSDLTSGHQTRMTVETVLYDRRLPARLFTPQALADESIEAEYRP